MLKILTVVGARPQFVKAATISRVIEEEYKNQIQEVLVHTGQHYDANMSELFFEQMQIPKPDYKLSVGGKSHGEMTGEMLGELEKLMLSEKPDLVLVYGDTNSTLAGALAAAKLHIPVAHVEAGLRARDKKIPEEVNRVLTDHVAKYFFCTSKDAVKNLAIENIQDHVHMVGDVMYDAALFYEKIATTSDEITNIPESFYLATVHRQENTDTRENLQAIFDAFAELEKPVVLPLHPRTKNKLKDFNITPQNTHILDPVGYFDMIHLIKGCMCVLTDSGGLQKEAYYFKKPVVVMRDVTEWIELVDVGAAKITSANKDKIIKSVNDLSGFNEFKDQLYGSGDSAKKIVEILFKDLSR